MKHIIICCVVLGLGAMILLSVGKSIYALYQASHRLSREQATVKNLEQQNTWLKQQISIVQKPEYIEKVARDQLSLAQDNDITLVVPKTAGIATESAQFQYPNGNWQRWYALFFR